MPKSLPIQAAEADHVRQEFKALLQEQRQCPAAIDADVSVTVDNAVWSGTLSGYLRAMAPAYLRFEGVNPLGLTEVLFAVDGTDFTYLSVRDQTVYLGPLKAEKIARLAPEGLATSMNYYWVLGRIPPGSLGIADIGLDENEQGHWLELRYAPSGERAMILFDAGQHLVKRHLVLSDKDAIVADFSYEYPHPRTPQGGIELHPTAAATERSPSAASPADRCQLPEKMTITKKGNGLIALNFTKRYPTPALDTAPFRITPPEEYKRIVFK